jgi:hypothetical protein
MYRKLRLGLCLVLTTLLATSAWATAEAKDPSHKLSPDKLPKQLKLDHFKFYKFKPIQTKFDVRVQGQFDKEMVPVHLPEIIGFANPVAKDRGMIIDKNAHLTLYKLLQRLAEPNRRLSIDNQFGKQELVIGKPMGLLVPTEKIEKGSGFPRNLDHYKVYSVLESKPVERSVMLKDQFDSGKVRIGKPSHFCVPVLKKHKKESPIVNEKAHITIYEIEPTKNYDLVIRVRDQFGKRKVPIDKSALLGVPTLKLSFEVLD